MTSIYIGYNHYLQRESFRKGLYFESGHDFFRGLEGFLDIEEMRWR